MTYLEIALKLAVLSEDLASISELVGTVDDPTLSDILSVIKNNVEIAEEFTLDTIQMNPTSD